MSFAGPRKFALLVGVAGEFALPPTMCDTPVTLVVTMSPKTGISTTNTVCERQKSAYTH